MRILYVTNSLEIGGVETNLSGLSAQLRRRGHEVSVASSGGALEAELAQNGVRHLKIPISLHPPTHLLPAALRLRGLVISDRHEIVHAMSAAGNLATMLIPRGRDVVFVTSPMGLQQSDRELRLITDVRNWFLTLRADRVLVISKEIAAAVSRLQIPPERLMSANIVGIDVRRFESSPSVRSRARAELGLPPDAEVVTTIGALHSRKRHDLFIAAALLVVADRPRARFLIVGEGPEREVLSRQIEALQLTSQVTLLGERRDIAAILAATDIYIKPGIVEGFIGVTVLEAMAARRPVVAWATRDVRAAISNDETGILVPIADTGALARAVWRLLNDREFADGIATRARVNVEQTYSLPAIAAQLEAIYAALLRDR